MKTKMFDTRVLQMVNNSPWAITKEGLETVYKVASRTNGDVKAIEKELGRKLENTQKVTVRNNVARVPIHGTIVKYGNIFTQVSGSTSYDSLMKDVQKCLKDDSITDIILDIDSPGGQVNGCSEFADFIYKSREKKNIVAYVGGSACSAAYWIASATNEIVINNLAELGSIGVVAVVGKKEDDGTLEITSSQTPYKRDDINSEDGRARFQETLDHMANVFIEAVARNRNVDKEKVIKEFGQGSTMIGSKAIEHGLADKEGSLETLLEKLTSKTEESHQNGGFLNENEKENKAMNLETLKAEHPALVEAIQAEAVSAAGDKAVQEDRKRIAEILALDEAKGNDVFARTLAMKGESVETAKEYLSTVAVKEPSKETTDPLTVAMENVGNVEIEASSEEKEMDEADKIIAAFNKQ